MRPSRDHFLHPLKASNRLLDVSKRPSNQERELMPSELNKYEFAVREEMNKAQRGLDLISKEARVHAIATVLPYSYRACRLHPYDSKEIP